MKSKAAAALLAVLAAAGGLAWQWQPSHQVSQKTVRLLDAAAARDWSRVEKLMAADYRDPWHHSRADALQTARWLGEHFLVLQIRPTSKPLITTRARSGAWQGRLEFLGRGNPFGEALLREAAALTEPFHFEWRRASWKPWDWKLTAASHPEIPAFSLPKDLPSQMGP